MYDIYDNDFDKAFDEAVDAIEKKEHRLIWADDLIACKFKNDISYNAFASLVRRQPTIDAEPTKHGRWIRKTEQLKDCTVYWYVCSECGERPLHGRLRADDALTNYCPNCGARMDAQIGEDKSHPFAESVIMGMNGGKK